MKTYPIVFFDLGFHRIWAVALSLQSPHNRHVKLKGFFLTEEQKLEGFWMTQNLLRVEELLALLLVQMSSFQFLFACRLSAYTRAINFCRFFVRHKYQIGAITYLLRDVLHLFPNVMIKLSVFTKSPLIGEYFEAYSTLEWYFSVTILLSICLKLLWWTY